MNTKVFSITVMLLWISLAHHAFAQRGIRIGYIDMDYILENVAEYQEAEAALETKVQKWKVEIEAELKNVDEMRKVLDNERVLLTKELIEEREEDILFKQKEILKYQQDRFGPNGDLYIQKRRLIQPIQDQVFVAVQEIAKNKKYDFIFDKSADVVMLYSADRYDISDQVMLRLNRVTKRKQVNNKRERKALERAEERNVDQEREVSDRERSSQKKQLERDQLLKERKAARDSLRASKKKEFEEKRAKLLALKQSKKDSITLLKKEKEQLQKQ